MGNQRSSYNFNHTFDESIQSRKPRSFLGTLRCSSIQKRKDRKSKLSSRYKSKSLNIPDGNSHQWNNQKCCNQLTMSMIENQDEIEEEKVECLSAVPDQTSPESLQLSEGTEGVDLKTPTLNGESRQDGVSNSLESRKERPVVYPKLSESSLNSDDLMLNTGASSPSPRLAGENEDEDDDVSKDYRSTEKRRGGGNREELLDMESRLYKSEDRSIEINEKEEEEDTFVVDISNESSSRLSRRSTGLLTSTSSVGTHISARRRPHSFSNPPSSTVTVASRHSSGMTAAESAELAWVWMLASETASVAQDVATMRLLLLRLRKLLLTEDAAVIYSPSKTASKPPIHILSEPSTPITSEELDYMFLTNNCGDESPAKDWTNSSKEEIMEELKDVQRQNKILLGQLSEKDRIIDLLKEHNYYRRSSRRLLVASSRNNSSQGPLNRSSTFDGTSTLYNPTAEDIGASP